MSQPVWQTPAGSLGTIPEGLFYQQVLNASVPFNPIPANCTQTSALTNLITCDTTQDVVPGVTVRFIGDSFGGITENTLYYVFGVPSSTTFSIAASADASQPLSLTTATGVMTARFAQSVYYRLQAGVLPQGMQLTANGSVVGVPVPVARVQGVPLEVARDVTSKFVVRAFTQRSLNGITIIDGIADRTFTITVTGNDVPRFVTPAGSIGTYYDGDEVDLQIEFTDPDPGDFTVIRLISGELPLGLSLSATGRIRGNIRPFPNQDRPPGYDLTASETTPYDFISAAISKNYQFTLEITDGKASDIRTFEIFVYNKEDLTADDTDITVDTTFVTADQTPVRPPFLINAEPSDIGTYRSENNFAYRFIGQDYDTEQLEYVIQVNEGIGLPPGLKLDPFSGWYYGTIPDVGLTTISYSFFIQVRGRSVSCQATDSATDTIVCDTTARGDFFVGAQVVFDGTSLGGITLGQVYYVANIVDDIRFQISTSLGGPVFALTTDQLGPDEYLFAIPESLPASPLYPFSLTFVGNIDREVQWLTPDDLGIVENGDISLLRIAATNTGGLPLQYGLAEGLYNKLPQGLALLPTGEISGQITFNTFAIDLGSTTFDASQSTLTRLDPTTFDSTFEFTVNAFAEDLSQPLYKVSAVKVLNGGSGFTQPPLLTFNAPTGATAVQATATVQVFAGSILSVDITNSGAGYTQLATYELTGPGTGESLQVIMQQTGSRRLISAFKTFRVTVARAYNKPYQNLTMVAMPPQNDRGLLHSLLSDQNIFVPEFIFRRDDPYFGVSQQVQYQHAFGLAPERIEEYIRSLDLNHYRKNLTLGALGTAQAVDVNGNVIYEVIYSRIIDDLVNNQGQSVSKIVTLPYAIIDPADGSTLISSVYPNSLINMRDQVVDTVGQISRKLPLWMTSRQANGTVLGFVPAWVICYTRPGRSQQIAYYIETQFGTRLNQIDFSVDRYVLDREMSRHWDTATQDWTPQPTLTTFDFINTTGVTNLGTVNACTELAFVDVQGRTVEEINQLGGLDGPTWAVTPGQAPPPDTRVLIRNGSRIIFVKQDFFERYPNTNQAFVNNLQPYDDTVFDRGDALGRPGSFDYGSVIDGGQQSSCTTTASGTNLITCDSTLGLDVNDKIWFTGTVFGGVQQLTATQTTQVYFCDSVSSVTATATSSVTQTITVSSMDDIELGAQIWFPGDTIGGILSTYADGQYRPYYVVDVNIINNTIEISDQPSGTAIALTTQTGNMTIRLNKFSVKLSITGFAVPLDDDSGDMIANFNNNRMAIYVITVQADGTLTLVIDTQTVTNDYVESTQGLRNPAGTLLYRPATPANPASDRVSWQPWIGATQVVTSQTTFDQNSVQWTDPVDMYDPTDEFDKYLVFPKTNILE
jgi:hypothetical protein